MSPEKIYLLFKKAIENSSNIGEICENIQKNLEAEISTAKIEGGGIVKPSTSSTAIDSSELTPSSGETPVSIGETPTQEEEAGEAPTETGSAPEPSTSPAEGPPPEY
ncbi:MAG: hypothetical protein FP833_08385 [Atribacteria sp.]|nr:hypothetical protein [Candidatus Atribacteria bacterium]